MRKKRVRFDRNEFAGAFGDIGTDLPLIAGMTLAAGLDSSSVLVMFGLMQWITGLTYGIPMAVQPLKAVAVIVITQKVSPGVLYGGGLAIGLFMLALTGTGAITWLARAIPRAVVRGLQLGLGLQLATLALRDYVPADGTRGYALAAAAFVIAASLLGNRRFPPALIIIALGLVYAVALGVRPETFANAAGFSLPGVRTPTWADVVTGFLVLAVPQVPLSLGNSILATRQIAHDLFPEREIGVRKLAVTYSAMNVVNPFLGGVPTCHGSGGLVGHYTFGARSGGSLLIYGALFITIGLFFANGFTEVIRIFPLPVLGVLLFFEAVGLLLLIRDDSTSRESWFTVVLVGLLAAGLPYGYAIALVTGTLVYRLNAARSPA